MTVEIWYEEGKVGWGGSVSAVSWVELWGSRLVHRAAVRRNYATTCEEKLRWKSLSLNERLPSLTSVPSLFLLYTFLREYECCVDEIRQKFATVFSHLLSRSSPSVTNIVHLIFFRSIMLFSTWIFAPLEKLYQCQRVAAWKGRCTIYLWQIRIWKEKTANKLKYINSTILSNWNMQIWKPGIVTENY